MVLLTRIATYHRTRAGLLIFGLAELLLAIVLFLVFVLFIDVNEFSIPLGLLGLVCLLGFMQNIVRLCGAINSGQNSVVELPYLRRIAFPVSVIALVLFLPLSIYFPYAGNYPALQLPAGYHSCSDSLLTCLCTGLAFDTAPPHPTSQWGFPFVTMKAGEKGDCPPPTNTIAEWLDKGAAALTATASAVVVTVGGPTALRRMRYGRETAEA